MSGGMYNYAFEQINSFLTDLSTYDSPLRAAFREHLQLVAKAMHDIEWADSGDYAKGDEIPAIQAVFRHSPDTAMLAEVDAQVARLVASIEQLRSQVDA